MIAMFVMCYTSIYNIEMFQFFKNLCMGYFNPSKHTMYSVSVCKVPMHLKSQTVETFANQTYVY